MYVHFGPGKSWCINIHVHVYTIMILKKYKRVCTLYVHGMYNERYKHVCTLFRRVFTLFRRVCTSINTYIRVLNHINMYIQCTNLYMQVLCSWCSVYRWLHTFHEPYRHRWTVYVHCCTSFWLQLFDFSGWLACHGRLGLAAAWFHAYSSSSTRV